MKILDKPLIKKQYAQCKGQEYKPCDYYWGEYKLPRFIGKFLWRL